MTWTLRTQGGERTGLTLYQLEALVHAGAVQAEDLLRADAPGQPRWQRVEDVPHLRRHLRVVVAPVGIATGLRVPLELTEDGQPRPLSDEAIAQLLAAASDAPSLRVQQRIGQVLWGVAAAIFATEAYVLLRAITHAQ